MKKIVIPAILLGTIMIAAGFAILPVEQAKAVHTTVLAGTAKPYQAECTVAIGTQAAAAAGTETVTLATAAGGDFSLTSTWVFHDSDQNAADDLDLVSWVVAGASARIPPTNIELAAAMAADQYIELMDLEVAAGVASLSTPQTLTSTGGAAGVVINLDAAGAGAADTARVVVSGSAEGGVAPTAVCT